MSPIIGGRGGRCMITAVGSRSDDERRGSENRGY